MADCEITRRHGDTWDPSFTVTDDATPPEPLPLTGATVVFTLETDEDTEEDFYFSDPAGATPNTAGISIVRVDAAGEFTLTLTAALMATLEGSDSQDPAARQYYWDVTVTFASGKKLTLVVGIITLEEKA